MVPVDQQAAGSTVDERVVFGLTIA